MKRISQTIARFFSVAFVLLFSLFSSSQSARANTVDDVITSVNVYNQKGEELTDGLSPWEKFQIDANLPSITVRFSQEILRPLDFLLNLPWRELILKSKMMTAIS